MPSFEFENFLNALCTVEQYFISVKVVLLIVFGVNKWNVQKEYKKSDTNWNGVLVLKWHEKGEFGWIDSVWIKLNCFAVNGKVFVCSKTAHCFPEDFSAVVGVIGSTNALLWWTAVISWEWYYFWWWIENFYSDRDRRLDEKSSFFVPTKMSL